MAWLRRRTDNSGFMKMLLKSLPVGLIVILAASLIWFMSLSRLNGGKGINYNNVQRNDPIKVSISDSPIMGNKNAKITLIEFSSYESTYSKKQHNELLPYLKTNYIDTGKIRLVYRNLPLSSIFPNAHNEAQAAFCARDQGGDLTYFKYHDELFKRAPSKTP